MSDPLEIFASITEPAEISAEIRGDTELAATIEPPAKLTVEIIAAGPQGPPGPPGEAADILHVDTTAGWNAQPSLVGQANHVYVYSDYQVIGGVAVPGLKIGDGQAYLIDTPFVYGGNASIEEHINDTTVHITAEERAFWNNKNRAYMSQGAAETLVLTTQ